MPLHGGFEAFHGGNRHARSIEHQALLGGHGGQPIELLASGEPDAVSLDGPQPIQHLLGRDVDR